MRISSNEFVLYLERGNDVLVLAYAPPTTTKSSSPIELVIVAQADRSGLNSPDCYNDGCGPLMSRPRETKEWEGHELVLSVCGDDDATERFGEARLKLFPTKTELSDHLSKIDEEDFNEKTADTDNFDFEDRLNLVASYM